jgi:glutamine amidotransferase
MTARTAIVVDYGMGNVLSVVRALESCGASVELTHDAEQIRRADRVVLPGVGAFNDCMEAFLARGLRQPLLDFVKTGRHLLGICVGMQILFERSSEFGDHAGLGIIPGDVKAIPRLTGHGARLKTPHIGWSDISSPKGSDSGLWHGTILEGICPGTSMYFVHSFTAWPTKEDHRLADASYGGQRISAAVSAGNVTGTQFHPEKSGAAGLNLLRNFLALPEVQPPGQ